MYTMYYMTEHYRKLHGRTDSDTVDITLPIGWVRSQGLTAGNAVRITEEHDGSLRVEAVGKT